ncbi:MAG: hypothetical protein AB1778_06505 [Candidatus Bipolaricaulota bacterium]
MKRRWMLLGAALLLAGGVAATGAESAITVLDVPPGVSRIGSGGAGLSLVSGAETIYYNPAGLSGLAGISFSSFYSSYLGAASYSAFALALKNFGVAAMLLNSGSIDGYDEDGNATADISFSNTAFVFSFGIDAATIPFLKSLPPTLSFGAAIKGLTAKVGADAGSGFTLDLGFRGGLPAFGSFVTDGAFAVTLGSIFGVVSYDDVENRFPMDLAVGASARLLGSVVVAADLHLAGGSRLGVTYEPVPTLALRAGLMTDGGLQITAGVGLDVQGFLIDYAFVSHSLGGSHRVGLTLDFSALDIGALGQSLRRILP